MQRVFAGLLMAGVSTGAIAQDDIVVTGNALPRTSADLSLSVKDIEPDLTTPRIEDVLRQVAGLTQFRRTDARSANATSQGVTFRGLGGNASSRALLLLDGVPQTDPFGGWVTWPAFAPNRIQNIRIIKGGGSGTMGPGALAGTIEMESISKPSSEAIGLSYGSRNAVDASARITRPLGSGFGMIAGSFARGDGIVPIIASQRGPADRRAPYSQGSIALRGVAAVSANTELQASVLAFQDRRTRGTALSGNGGDGADASLRLVHNGKWQAEASAYLQARKFQSRFVAIDATRSSVTQTVDQFNVPSTGLGGKFELRPPIRDGFSMRMGVDWRTVQGESREAFTFVSGVATRDREAGGKNITSGAFAEIIGELASLTVSASGRFDHWVIKQGRLVETTRATGAFIRNERAQDRDGWVPTGRLGASNAFGPMKLRAVAYLGWRSPTLNELYRPFRVGADATAANAALSPEKMRGGEIGASFTPDESLLIGITAFKNRLINPIANVSLGAGPGTFPGVGFVASGGVFRQRQNVYAIQSRGVEVDAHWALRDLAGLDFSYAVTDAKLRASGVALPLNGLRPAQTPKHMLSAGLVIKKRLSLSIHHLSSQFEDDLNVRKLGAATSLDAGLTLPLSRFMSLGLRAENLTNSRIDAAISGTGIIERARPRTFSIALYWERE